MYEKELIAICLAVHKWKHYLLGRHFIVIYDQQSLRFLSKQRDINPDYQKWVTKLLGFDFEIQFKPGASNRVADALSRKNVGEVVLNALVATAVVSWEKLENELQGDSDIQHIKREIETGTHQHKHFSLVNNRLMYKGRCVLPR